MDHEFDELKREFLAEAETKIQEIGQVTEKISEANLTESVDRAAYLAHQLKGAGGSYGFQKISTEAASFEKALERIPAEGLEPVRTALKSCVDNLSGEVALRIKELSISPVS
ncbi:MAG TPA: Hpt domain-containing protein [Thermoanaerobaculia bacterium]|nr:Hpt domain-containing protein [Thermoanaerobaculia bacterium]